MMTEKLILGWDAPPISEQFPEIPMEEASRFDEDMHALSWLRVRYMSDTEHGSLVRKISRSVERALKKARKPLPASAIRKMENGR